MTTEPLYYIERFSEDIDLILGWREIIGDNSNPQEERSKTKQDQYNKQINSQSAEFYRDALVPLLNSEFSEKLETNELCIVDGNDDMVINFYYPQIFDHDYLRNCVRLEIGPLAEWLPSHITTIIHFSANKYPTLLGQEDTETLTIDVERTFWEKITILHKIANFPTDNPLPSHYAIRLYDVYSMENSWVKEKAFERKKLLEKYIPFKQKFYYIKSAHYETATLKTVSLVPSKATIPALSRDYEAMNNMIYGDTPDFGVILAYLGTLEQEIHILNNV